MDNLPPGSPRWGQNFKSTLQRNFTRSLEIFAHGTSLPVEDNSFSLDDDVLSARRGQFLIARLLAATPA